MTLLKFIPLFLFVLVLYVLHQGLRMRNLIAMGKITADDAVPFSRIITNAPLKILVAGDSTAVGTGAKVPEESVAGRFGTAYPTASLKNLGRNGKRVAELLTELRGEKEGGYALVLIMIGGNDITHITPLTDVERDARATLKEAKRLGKQVVVVHSGNLGASPLFPWPISSLLTWRTKQVRSIYIQLAKEEGVTYTDLFAERIDDIFLKDWQKYYLSDLFHPSSEGYAIWFEKITEAMKRDGVVVR